MKYTTRTHFDHDGRACMDLYGEGWHVLMRLQNARLIAIYNGPAGIQSQIDWELAEQELREFDTTERARREADRMAIATDWRGI